MTTEERERRMAMLRAAQPYTSGQQRYALDLLLQANTLIWKPVKQPPGRRRCFYICRNTALPENPIWSR